MVNFLEVMKVFSAGKEKGEVTRLDLAWESIVI